MFKPQIAQKSIVCITLSFWLAAVSSQMQAAGDVTFRRMEEYLSLKGVGGEYNVTKLVAMSGLMREAIRQAESNDDSIVEPEEVLKSKRIAICSIFMPKLFCQAIVKDQRISKLDKENKKEILPFLKHGLNLLEKASDDEEKKHAFYLAKKILYSIFATSYEGRKLNFDEMVKFPFTKFKTRLRYLNPKERSTLLGAKDAKKESLFLTESLHPKHYLTVSDLEKLSSEEISHLDVRVDNPFWYRKEKTEGKDEKLWNDFYERIRLQTQANLAEKKSDPNLQYDFEEAQRMVFFSKIKKNGGTHPKIAVKDPYGRSWKLKWGNEVYSETVASRLYMALGGKHQDLTFSHTGQKPILLIFKKEENGSDNSDVCSRIVDFTALNTCIKKSRFKTDLQKYVHHLGFGKITEDNIQIFVSRLSENLKSQIDVTDLMGSHYVFMQDASLEFNGKDVYFQSGPMAQSTLGAQNDRGMRGLGLFYLFVDNFDAKDDNGEAVLVKDENNQWQYIESPVDLGGAFRGFAFRKRGINYFKEQNFLRYSRRHKHRLIYTEPLLYRPRALEKATFADLLWMAKKIALLKESVIRAAVEASHMPDFFQEVLIYKILKRRNHIAKLFNIEHLCDIKDDKLLPPTLFVELSTPKQRQEVASRYGLPLAILENAMVESNLNEIPFFDQPVEGGRILSCRKSFLVNLLEKYLYPTGLGKEKSKRKLKSCQFKPRFR